MKCYYIPIKDSNKKSGFWKVGENIYNKIRDQLKDLPELNWDEELDLSIDKDFNLTVKGITKK